jgi:signal transduction histidine kinase
MLRTLYAKLTLALALLLIGVGILYTTFSLSATQHYLQETGQTLNLDLARNLVAENQLVQSGKLDKEALKATFMKYMVINPSIELYLLDLDGRILSYSADPGKVKRRRVSVAPIRAFLRGARLPLLGDDPRSYTRQKIFSVTPVPSAENPEGYLYVVLLGERYDNVAGMIRDSLVWRQSAWALVSSIGIALLIGIILFRRLTLRLHRLSRSMAAFRNEATSSDSGGDNGRGDEIDILTATFEQMARRITEQLDDLKNQDELRRELVANVSHDLRTPIAVLHGYLETLKLKDAQLDAQQRNEYIAQALHSSNRLQQLISELFELAQLEAPDMHPDKERFNLAELVHDVSQKFELNATRKDVRLDLQIVDEDCFIEADISLLARLFENLLSNAIKYSPEHTVVVIRLYREENHLVCDTRNQGPAIAAIDLPHVFKRFYQGRHKAHRQQPGGLGLAIAKRVVDLHHGIINVTSSAEQGTCFRVSLPTA